MNCLVFLLTQITIVYSAPLQLQLLQPQTHQSLQLPSQQSALLQQLIPWQQIPQQVPLVQQLLALQQLQAIQRLNLQSSVMTHLQRPLLILLPKLKSEHHQLKIKPEDVQGKHGKIDEDADSIVIDSAHDTIHTETQKAVLLIPNDGRLGIGDVISNIPFLPIEINVPDSIAWISNWISGIISGIGQTWPFRPQVQNMQNMEGDAMRNWQMKTMAPVLLIPLNQNV